MKRKKTGEPSLREKLSQSFLEALTADFAINGPAVIEKMRATHPERYAELAAKMIMTAEPQQKADGFASDTSMEAVARRLLNSVGMVEPDGAAIEAAIAANDVFVAALESIRDRASFGGNGHDAEATCDS